MPEFPQTCPKCFLFDFCLQIFSHKNHEDRFMVRPRKKGGLHLFLYKRWMKCFEVKQCWGPFLQRFSGILPRFSGILSGISGSLSRFSGILPIFSEILPGFSNQNFWGCACTPASYTTIPEVRK